jgi:type I restriction enzyme S subunit
MSEWQETTLEAIAEVNPLERLPKGTLAKKMAMEALQPYTKKISGFVLEEYKGGTKFKNGDTLIARITPCLENGKTAFVDILEEDEVAFGSTEFIVLREKAETSDKQFLYYFATSPIFREVAILSMTGSSGRQRVQTEVVTSHLFDLPLLPEQQAIAEVLSSLDDKIDLLHRQNQTLEALAETLFRQWFIEEADPAWEEKPLSFFGQIICGKTPSKTEPEYFGGDIPFIKIPDMHNKIYIDKTTDSLSKKGKASQLNKTIPAGSICVSCIATVGLVAITMKDSQTNQQINSIVPNNDIFTVYLYFSMRNLKGELEAMASGGTATPNLNTGDFSRIHIVLPEEQKLKFFQKQSEPMFGKIKENQQQIQKLEKTRDELLPKLMSGEVRVNQINLEGETQ